MDKEGAVGRRQHGAEGRSKCQNPNSTAADDDTGGWGHPQPVPSRKEAWRTKENLLTNMEGYMRKN